MRARLAVGMLIPTVAAALGLTLEPGSASAAVITFVEQGDSVIVTPDANFECGVSFIAKGESATAQGCWGTSSPAGYSGSAVAYMVEPATDPNPGAVSDEIHIDFDVVANRDGSNSASISISFLSDTDGAPPTYVHPGTPVLVEDGTLQSLNAWFIDPATGTPLPPPDRISILALSEAGGATPTRPATWGTLKALYK